MNDQLRSELELADPVGRSGEARLHEIVARMATEAQAVAAHEPPSTSPWWKRRRTVLPLGIVSVAALTGGAILIPLSLSVDGTAVEADAKISIVYTTDSGTEVGCRYWIYFGEPGGRDAETQALVDFMATHNWTGIGQRIYEEAIANPFVPGRDGGLQSDSAEARDEMSFAVATDRLIEAEIPTGLRGPLTKEGTISSSTSDCKGELR